MVLRERVQEGRSVRFLSQISKFGTKSNTFKMLKVSKWTFIWRFRALIVQNQFMSKKIFDKFLLPKNSSNYYFIIFIIYININDVCQNIPRKRAKMLICKVARIVSPHSHVIIIYHNLNASFVFVHSFFIRTIF